MRLPETILTQMSSLSKPQKIFTTLLTSISSCYGKVNYSNLSRFNGLNEKTFRRWFNKPLDFININRLGNQKGDCRECVLWLRWTVALSTKAVIRPMG
ncbi:MAG: hypothetical protein IPL02_12480 [Moraxellaceae bacterium]|nr:hypothetical protein [Moraxellaceae bacterium]